MAPKYRKIEQWGTDIVGQIFFTPISFGPVCIQLITFFSCASLFICCLATRSVMFHYSSTTSNMNNTTTMDIPPCTTTTTTGGGIMTSCNYHSGETYWYRKATRYRAERNFWLSLFTLVLWLLVYLIYTLKREIVHLRRTAAVAAEDSTAVKKKEK